jgi:hypothetical protein
LPEARSVKKAISYPLRMVSVCNPSTSMSHLGRAPDVWFVELRPPAWQFAAPARVLDALLHRAHGVEMLVKLARVAGADAATQILRIRQHRSEHAFVAGGGVLEQAVNASAGYNASGGVGELHERCEL